MKAVYILSTIAYRLSWIALALAVVLGVIFVPMAHEVEPVLKMLLPALGGSAVLVFAFRFLRDHAKKSILASMNSSEKAPE